MWMQIARLLPGDEWDVHAYTQDMQDEASVLLLSVGETPTELKSELERLNVRVIETEFLDAEERIEEEQPDLVVLAGGRGAMELATLLDDQEGEHRARMVIVAERKELAKLRGLNREVVISLFALETTEKVVAQRVESLARRAARRRAQALGGAMPVTKKTSLGLPSGQAVVGQLNLKKKVANPPSPPSSQAEAKEVANKEAAANEAGAKELAANEAEVVDEDLVSLPPSIPPEGTPQKVNVPAAGKMPEMAADDSPVSSPPTLPPEAKNKPRGKSASGKSGKAQDEDGFDISDAEDALENLDSQKAEITPELLKEAKKIAESQPRREGEALPEAELVAKEEIAATDDSESVAQAIDQLDSTENEEVSSGPESDLQELGESAFLDIDSVFDGATKEGAVEEKQEEKTSADSLNESETPIDGEAPEPSSTSTSQVDASTGDSPSRVLSEEQEPPSSRTGGNSNVIAQAVPVAEPERDDDTRSQEEESAASSTGPALVEQASLHSESEVALPEKRSGNKVVLFAAVAVLGLGGAYFGGAFAPKSETSTRTEAPANNASLPGADEKAPTSTVPPPAADTLAAEPAKSPAETAPPETGEEEDASEPEQAASSALKNPFKEPDTNRPTCEQLVAQDPVEAESDPVAQASVIWNEARRAIVAGKLEKAHLKMCQAVTLNPESAAIEGLATLYLREKSTKQALRWADKAEELRPGQSEMGYLRGDIYSLMGEIEKARKIWLETLNIPSEETARIQAVSRDYSVEAGRHLRRGDLIRAEQWFRRAVILDPDNIGGIIGLAKAFHRADMPKYARAFCEMSLKVSDEIPEVHVMLGELALADGDQQGARVRFDRALAVRPGFFPAKRGLAQLKD